MRASLRLLRGGVLVLAQARLHLVRRTRRADRDHAPRVGRATVLVERGAVPSGLTVDLPTLTISLLARACNEF